MCDPITMMTAGASILSTALGVAQQMQRAASQRGDYDYLAAEQRNAAVADARRLGAPRARRQPADPGAVLRDGGGQRRSHARDRAIAAVVTSRTALVLGRR
ncbi:MAG: hypothetical protein AAB398_07245 [Pseudomonadota bacterium]